MNAVKLPVMIMCISAVLENTCLPHMADAIVHKPPHHVCNIKVQGDPIYKRSNS
jgi:hypothetical protein